MNKSDYTFSGKKEKKFLFIFYFISIHKLYLINKKNIDKTQIMAESET